MSTKVFGLPLSHCLPWIKASVFRFSTFTWSRSFILTNPYLQRLYHKVAGQRSWFCCLEFRWKGCLLPSAWPRSVSAVDCHLPSRQLLLKFAQVVGRKLLTHCSLFNPTQIILLQATLQQQQLSRITLLPPLLFNPEGLYKLTYSWRDFFPFKSKRVKGLWKDFPSPATKWEWRDSLTYITCSLGAHLGCFLP